jgi:hypothetical protein
MTNNGDCGAKVFGSVCSRMTALTVDGTVMLGVAGVTVRVPLMSVIA